MKKHAIVLLGLAASISPLAAQTVNFSEHISPIIYNNCTKCHRPGEIGPFPLTNYNEAATRAQMIKYVTGIHYMPPWMPDRSYSKLLDERFLTDEQIQLIAQWVDAGAPQGDPNLEAPLPSFPTGSQLGTPDLVLSMSQSYTIKGNNVDEYRIFVLPTGLTQDQDIAAVEFRPGNRKIVHHALIAIEVNGQGRLQDQQDAAYGYPSYGGFGVAIQGQLPGYAPGTVPRFFPASIGQKIPKNADLLLQIHYAPRPVAESDSSSLNIFFAQKPIARYLQVRIMLPFDLVNGPFIIPAGEVKQFHGIVNVPFDVSLLSFWPHCHLLGKAWELYTVDAQGQRTNLIKINNWDFNWQGGYSQEHLIKIPAGAQVHAFATYDNTVNNPRNPNHPPKQVTWGEKTTDEMYYFPLAFVPYQPGDEDILLTGVKEREERAAQISGYALAQNYPNPFNPITSIKFSLPRHERVQLVIYDLLGKKVATLIDDEMLPAGEHVRHWEASGAASGVYFYALQTENLRLIRKMALVR